MLNITPETLQGAYDFLRSTEPFCRWNLPDGEDVKFKVVKTHKNHAWYRCVNYKHVMAVSSNTVGHTLTLLESMAHEMIHMYEVHALKRQPTHGKVFQKWKAEVCKFHGFDPKRF